MGKMYTGIDVGSRFLKLAVCGDGSIKNIVTEPVPSGLIQGGRISSYDAMADFLKATIARHGGVSRQVALVLSSSLSLTRRLNLPLMTEQELLLNLPYEFRDYITDGKEHYHYDYAVLGIKKASTPSANDGFGNFSLDPIEPAVDTLDIMAVAMRKDELAECREMCRRAGLTLRIAMPQAAALQNLVRASGRNGAAQAAPNCCIIDFGNEATNLFFFTNGLYDATRTIELGGKTLDQRLGDAFSVDEHVAVSYKESNYENVLTGDVAREVYESLAIEIGRAVNFYNFNNPDLSVDVAYVSGGGVLVLPLVDAVTQHLDIPVIEVSTIMPPVRGELMDMRVLCPAAVGATMME